MALRYVCDFCGEIADWLVQLREVTAEPTTIGREIATYSRADTCTNDLSNAVTEMAKIHSAHNYDEDSEFHSIQITIIDQSEALARDSIE